MARSIYPTIAQSLRADIRGGVYPFQSLLPTEAQLCERFGCSHSAVRRALQELAAKGYVQARQGRGVTVIWKPERDETAGFATGGLETFPEMCAARGLEPKTELLVFERIAASEAFAQESGFEPGTPLVHMRRLRIASGTPASVEDTYTAETEIPGITPEIAVSGTYNYIENELGIEILTSLRTFALEVASADDARLLNVEPGSYLARVVSRTFCSTGAQFELIYSRQHPDFFSARVVVTRPKR